MNWLRTLLLVGLTCVVAVVTAIAFTQLMGTERLLSASEAGRLIGGQFGGNSKTIKNMCCKDNPICSISNSPCSTWVFEESCLNQIIHWEEEVIDTANRQWCAQPAPPEDNRSCSEAEEQGDCLILYNCEWNALANPKCFRGDERERKQNPIYCGDNCP